MTIERIWLTGFMGTGKSRIARPLAAALDWTALDIDTMIEREAGDSIAHIFKTGGEGAFRALEAQVVETVSRMPQVVIATGGGTVLSPANRDLMRKDSYVIALDARPETILSRIKESGGHVSERPLLAGGDPHTRVVELKQERDAIYRDADLFVETDELTPDEITHKILMAYRERTTLAGTTP